MNTDRIFDDIRKLVYLGVIMVLRGFWCFLKSLPFPDTYRNIYIFLISHLGGEVEYMGYR